jgi:hypothetical protein
MLKLNNLTFNSIILKNIAQRIDLNTLLDYTVHIQLCQLINALRKKKKIVIITRAGILASVRSK